MAESAWNEQEVLGEQNFDEDILLPLLKDILIENSEKIGMQWVFISNDITIKHNIHFSSIYFMHYDEVHRTVNKIRNRLKYNGARRQAPKLLKITKYDLEKMIKKLEEKITSKIARN